MQKEGLQDEKHMGRGDKYEEYRTEIYGKSLFLKKGPKAVDQKQ